MSYEVVITVKQRFSVKADSYDEAVDKANGFVHTMKPPEEWGKGVCWEDQEIVKQTGQ